MQHIPAIRETQNVRLAAAIIAAGIKPYDVQRRYTPEEEARYGLRARDCAAQNLGGTIGIQFAECPELDQVIAAYADQQKTGGDSLSLRQDEPEWTIRPDEMARLACYFFRLHSDLVKLTKSPDIAYICEAKGKPTHRVNQRDESGKVIDATLTMPSFKMCKDRDELRKELGL